jgi:CheY-like chemotaxis protein/two-component sensor histidine kinase
MPQLSDPLQKSYLESIQSGAKSLLTLINDILDLSKIEAGKLSFRYEPVSLIRIIEEIRSVFSPAAQEKGLDFAVDISPALPTDFMLDEVRLRQILFNLVGNAVKFTDRGRIGVTAEVVSRADCTVDLRLSVSDTGIGIPPESKSTVFEAFRQHDALNTKKYGGTGLGLTITRRLVEMMGGRITLESEVDVGTCFTLTLPEIRVADPKTAAPSSNDEGRECELFSPAVILVADDAPSNRKLLGAHFSGNRLGEISIVEAADGTEAVRRAEETLPDLILMDVRMPGTDGIEATRRLKADPRTAGIPIVLITASGMKTDRDKISDCGADGFLLKPVGRSRLLQEISRFLKTIPSSLDATPPQSDAEPKAIAESTIDDAQRRYIINRLETEFDERRNLARGTGLFDEIKAFAKHLRTFGEEIRLSTITKYADELSAGVDQFDIEAINRQLDGFPDLIRKLKKEMNPPAGSDA